MTSPSSKPPWGPLLHGAAALLLLGLALLSIHGCSETRTYSVEPAGDVLVLARHELKVAAGTETFSREVTGIELTSSGPDGRFTLTRATGGMFETPYTQLILSRPGYELFCGDADGDNHVGPTHRQGTVIQLLPTHDYEGERLAQLLFERESGKLSQWLGPETLAAVSQHAALRQAHLQDSYPTEWSAETARLQQAMGARAFSIRIGAFADVLDLSWSVLYSDTPQRPRLLALVALPGDGLAVVHTTETGRGLLVLDASGQSCGAAPLTTRSSEAALTRAGDGELAVYDDSAILSFDELARPIGRLELEPALPTEELVTALALDGRHIVLGVVLPSGAHELRRYSRSGQLLETQPLVGMRELSRLIIAPDGAVLAHGALEGDFDYGLMVAGMHKQDGMPHGILRLTDDAPGAAPELLLTGLDAMIPATGGFWGYARDLYAPLDQRTIQAGFTAGRLHQVLLRYSWAGELQETLDVTDARVGTATLSWGLPSGERLVAREAGRVLELDVAAARRAGR